LKLIEAGVKLNPLPEEFVRVYVFI